MFLMAKAQIQKSNNFLNNIKIPSVPPILISGETMTNILEKANIFNKYFVSQSNPLENNSKLPSLLLNTNKPLNTVSIKKDDITSIIKSLNPTKAPVCLITSQFAWGFYHNSYCPNF